MAEQLTAVTFKVTIDGNPLPSDVEIVRATIEDNLHHPDSFELELRDIGRSLVKDHGLKIGSVVSIGVVGDASPTPVPLMKGELTALDAEIDAGTNVTILRGYDHSHRLFRGRATASFQDVTYSDVVQRVAADAGLSIGTVDSTSPIHEHVGRANQTSWEFLAYLAQKVGYDVVVADGTFHFRKPVEAGTPSGNASLSREDPLELLLGSTLLRVRASVTSTGQADEVEVRGWDPKRKEAIVAKEPVETTSATIDLTPKELAGKFPNKPVVATRNPVRAQAEADVAAKALAEDVASSFVQVHGVARGNPKLKAGVAVRLGLIGEPFDGKYVLTSTQHVYDRYEGYTTHFTVSGRDDPSFLDLASLEIDPSAMTGLVIGIVDDVDDEDERCRVRLKFPWLSDDFVSDWARTVQVGAGSKRGWIIVPEVGDEVLVGFEHGRFDRPYVLGGLYNGPDEPDLGGHSLLDSGKHSVDVRRFVSRKGHALTFSDADGKERIEVQSKDGSMKIEIDISASKIRIESAGTIEMKAATDISLEATSQLSLKGNRVAIDAQSALDATASGNVTVRGALIQLN